MAIFDLLRSEVELSDKGHKEVKQISKALLEKLKTTLVIDWRKKQRTKAQVKRVIENVLEELSESYDDKFWLHSVEKFTNMAIILIWGKGVNVYDV